MTKIAIIGPGAIGGTVAAWLARLPLHEITVCARTAFAELRVETPDGPLLSRPRVITDATQGDPVDWVLIATKAYDSASAAPWLKTLIGPETAVAVLQNGVEHIERFAPYVSRDRILPVVVDCPAERSAPGKIVQRGTARMTVPDTDAGRAFRGLFSGTRFEVETTGEFLTAAWKKLSINCAGAVSAVTLKPAIVVRRALIADLMRAMIRECVAVGRAVGASLSDSLVETIIATYAKAPPDSINSLHADRLAGRPMEIDARNGVIVRLGAKHGIPTPLNQAMVALLTAIQDP